MKLIETAYQVDGVALTGFLADGSEGRPAPRLLVAHESPGITRHAKERAQMLADLGYVALALDMYGPLASVLAGAAIRRKL
jgi:dienelactone hydrolase